MLDPQLLRNEIEFTASQLSRRGFKLNIGLLSELEDKRKTLQMETQELQQKRNQGAKAFGQAKAQGKDVESLKKEMSEVGVRLDASQLELNELITRINNEVSVIPNLPHESVPNGKNESENVVVRQWGEKKSFNFSVKDHVKLGEDLDGLNFDLAAKISGSRFVCMKGQLARLHRALIQFMLDCHTMEHGYTEVYVPYLVNEDSLRGTGQLPKFKEDLFEIENDDKSFYLIPTAEVPVTNMLRDVIADVNQLPLKFVAHTPCFRSEAGSYGKDTRGLIRQHQFEKVELVQFVEPDKSYDALEALTGNAEKILQKLNLPYQVVSLCAGDIGFSSAKTFDLEVWLPGQQCYREISSCSNFESFQARRMKARWRNPESKKPELLHTINGSGLAVGRTLVAIMENYQNEDGSISIPEVLLPYMGGLEQIIVN